MSYSQFNNDHYQRITLVATIKKNVTKLLKLWWIFLIIAIIAGALGILYSISNKPKFKSRATFALNDGEGSGVGNILNLAAQFGITSSGGKDVFAGDNILEIIKSRRIIEQVLTSVDTFNHKPYTLIQYFIDMTEKKEPKKTKIVFPVGQAREQYTYQQDSVLLHYYNLFSNLITAQRPDKKLSLFEINVTTPDEVLSKIFTDKLLNASNIFYTEIRTKKSKQTLEILEKRVAGLKVNLNQSISERATVQDVNVNPAFEKAEVPVIKQQANIQVYSAAYAELFKNLELARFQYLNEIPLMQIIDKSRYPMQKIKLGKAKAVIIFIFIAEVIFLLILGIKYVMKD